MIISISGRIGSGKDTVAAMIKQASLSYNWEVKKFAGLVKHIASLLTGAPVEKFESQDFKKQWMGDEWGMSYREFLQRMATDAMRDVVHEDIWVNALMKDYVSNDEFTEYFDGVDWIEKPISLTHPNWIITDTRFENELDAIENKLGILVKVVRPGEASGESLHSSETALDYVDYWDYVIENSGDIDELRYKVICLLDELDLLN
jgi:hypothetical protein